MNVEEKEKIAGHEGETMANIYACFALSSRC